jgi:Flp pilus assembly protein TadG
MQGATSLEFALVLPVFILILYGLILYAMVFAAHHTLVQASGEGARAALRHGTTAQRELAACDVARSAASWITSVAGTAPTCAVTADCANAPCRRVRVTYDYRAHPLVPTPALMAAFVPTQLQSDAIVHFMQ